MKAGESMRQNFAQILKDAKIDIKVEYQKLYGMLYDRSIPVSNTNRISGLCLTQECYDHITFHKVFDILP